jgi:hypothetical protein
MGPEDQADQGAGGENPRRDQGARARELGEKWLGQLQDMIDQAGRQAGPVLRDVAAKAAELAAVAAENAGPVAHKAATVTEHVGDRLAARSKDLAADLRKAAEAARANATGAAPAAPAEGETPEEEKKDAGPEA